MPIREFEISGTKKVSVTEMGLRAHIYSIGYKYHVRIAPENVSRKLVRIVVSGGERVLNSFYSEAVKYCTRELGLSEHNVKHPRDYRGLEPNWSEYATMFSTEQTSKGVDYLQKTHDKLDHIDRKFGVISDKLSYSNKRLDTLVKNLTPMSEISATLQDISVTLKALRDKLPK